VDIPNNKQLVIDLIWYFWGFGALRFICNLMLEICDLIDPWRLEFGILNIRERHKIFKGGS